MITMQHIRPIHKSALLLIVGGLVLAGSLGALLPLFTVTLNLSLVVPAIPILLMLGPRTVRWATGRVDVFSVVACSSALMLVGYTVFPWIQASTDTWLLPHFWDPQVSLSYALWLAILGVLAFIIGTRIRTADRVARSLPVGVGLSRPRIAIIATVYLLVGLTLSLAYFQAGGGLSVYLYNPRAEGLALGAGYITLGLELTAVASYLAAYLAFTRPHTPSLARKSRFGIPVTWMFFAGTVLAFLISALLLRLSRQFILTEVLVLAIMYHYLVRPLRLRALLLPTLIALLFAVFLGVIRNPAIYGQLDTVSPGGIWEQRDLIADEMGSYAPLVALFDLGRAEILAGAVENLPITPDRLFWGRTYLAAFLQVIPRQIWPEKWFTSAGEFTDLVFWPGYYREYREQSGTWGTSMMVDGYMNAHIPGIMLGSFLVGLLLSVTERYRLLNQPASSTVMVYAMAFPFLLMLPLQDFGVFLFTFGRHAGPLIVAIWLASLARQPAPAGTRVPTGRARIGWLPS